MVHFAEINQASSLHSMLQYFGRVATPKIDNGGLVSEFIWSIVGLPLGKTAK